MGDQDIVERNTLVAILCRMTTKPGRDHRTGHEFVHGATSQEVVDALRAASTLLRADSALIESLRSELARIAKEREEDRRRHFEQAAQVADDAGNRLVLGELPHGVASGIAAAIRQMGEMPECGACVHDWFDCSNAAVPPPAKSCRKCGWTCGGDETHGLYIEWPWLAGRAALEKETRE